MQLDRHMMERLLTMNDEQLSSVIRSIAAEAGIDPVQLGLDPASIQNIRQALGSATDRDLQRLNEVYDSYKQSRRSK